MNKEVIEILTEEPSMEYFLRGLLPRILPADYALDINCFIRPHSGKSDLQKSIPKKMRAYPRFGYPIKVLIIHDQDSNNCVELKDALVDLTNLTIHDIPCVVRIACKELENWYLGDFFSLERIYSEIDASKETRKAKFRNPDHVFGANEIEKLTNRFSKTVTAREIGSIIDIAGNKSQSFQHFVSGISKLISL